MRILVTGGAGYIGSTTAAHLLDRGHAVRVLDDLSTGHRAAIPASAEFVEGALEEAAVLASALAGIDAVVHFAARSLVGESTRDPLTYFRANVGGTLCLLEGMRDTGVRRLVFSSTAAVYGEPGVDVIDESTPLAPINPYGHTKAMVERVLAEEARAGGLAAMALRYFNACGADGPRGEDHRPETHLIPRLCAFARGALPEFRIHGGGHATPDGSAIRDYVHVVDLARAHALAVEALDAPGFEAINLGSGVGASVREVIAAAESVVGRSLEVPEGPPRDGDPARLVASRDRAATRLGWAPDHDLSRILADAWAWHSVHPDGYSGDGDDVAAEDPVRDGESVANDDKSNI